MKNKKSVVITSIIIILIVLIGLIAYRILSDDNKLTASEKKWINDNINTVQNINVINNINIFGNTGSGVFYEFISDIEKSYKLQINPVTFNYGENPSGLTLGIKSKLNENDKVFYTDHYVLVGKKSEIMSYQDLSNKKIGVINSELSNISYYLKNISGINLTGFNSENELLDAFKGQVSEGEEQQSIDYILVPLTLYLDNILENDYYIVKHLSDIEIYFTISGSEDNILTRIVKKYYNNWYKDHLDEYFKREEFNLFNSSLGITETEVDAIQSITYNYGFANNSPYEVIMSGNYGGIIAVYLDDFSRFAQVEFNYKKYRDLNRLKRAISKNEIDLYFNYYALDDNLNTIDSNIIVNYSIIANKDNDVVIHSLNGLSGKTVYVEKNSFIHRALLNIENVNIKTYDDERSLKKLNKKDVIIAIDKNVFNLYSGSRLSNYTERYSDTLNETYEFKSKNNTAFYKLFSKYIMTLDQEKMIYKGMYNHSMTVKTGSIVGTIAQYILLTIFAFLIIFIVFYKSGKKIKIAKKIKKEDKMKYIDQLTSLKNRNYLNEYIHNWNNNTIYPQTMIIIDLNNIQFVNDTLGYEEGDKQIKAAANVLIKTQLDNSDIMRTDGNEFLIYLVGYTQKQITNYIHKLNKEFKKLPYEYGAEFGYSMINDNVKTIEDAILEATDEMKKQKKNKEEGK